MITNIIAWIVIVFYCMLVGSIVVDFNRYDWKNNILSLGLTSLPIVLGVLHIMGGR